MTIIVATDPSPSWERKEKLCEGPGTWFGFRLYVLGMQYYSESNPSSYFAQVFKLWVTISLHGVVASTCSSFPFPFLSSPPN